MKVLSIRQPWGSIICSGLKHVENRSWALKTLPMRILIHVGATKMSKYDGDDYLPEQWVSLMRNARTMGYLPEKDALPYSAIIGWADVVRCDEPGKNTSDIWAQNDFTGWVLENVHVFDEPILNVKGKLGIFDYPLEEADLPPSHPAIFKDPDVNGDEVVMPVSDKVWNVLETGEDDVVIYDLTNDNVGLFVDEEGNQKPLKTITILNKGRAACYELTDETGIFSYLKPNGEPYTFMGLDGQPGYQWVFVQFVFGNKLG